MRKKTLFPPISDGQPVDIELVRFPRDNFLRGHYWIECCDCGLTHMLTFMLTGMNGRTLKQGAPKGMLTMRGYRCPLNLRRNGKRSR